MISAKEFVKVWQESDSVTEVCEKTGLKMPAAKQRASNYRRKGVPLKYMGANHRPDWDALAEYARLLEETQDGDD